MANKTQGQNTGHTDEAILISDGIAVTNMATVKILDKEVVSEGQQPQRLLIVITARGQDVFIKYQPADVDNDPKGIPILRNVPYEIRPDAMFFGEISAQAVMGNATVYVTVL